MRYELVDTHTGNWVGFHDTEEEALRAVAETLRRYGPGAVATLALGGDDAEGDGVVIAEGPALVALARKVRTRAAGGAVARPRTRTKR